MVGEGTLASLWITARKRRIAESHFGISLHINDVIYSLEHTANQLTKFPAYIQKQNYLNKRPFGV
jgi:hypothetical protein